MEEYTEKKPKFCAVVLAAGSGSRMQSKEKKQFMPLLGKPVMVHSLLAFEAHPLIDSVVLVVAKGDMQLALEICLKHQLHKVKNIVEGAELRFRSVYNGVKALDADTDYVLIHDGARPLLSEELIGRCCDAAEKDQACVAAVRVTDTIKTGDRENYAAETLDRSALWSVQTPQAFSYPLFCKAYEKLFETISIYHPDETKITDDAMIVESMTDQKVRFVEGEYSNIKITTPTDLVLAKALLEARCEGME